MVIIGVDLAWGEKNSDGLCVIRATRQRAEVTICDLTHGDESLVAFIRQHAAQGSTLVCIDAPIVCPNLTGTRPVDRLTHRMFHRQHAACHPANLTKCPRPPRVAAALLTHGFQIGTQLSTKNTQLLAEVYPHPAMVRLFGLDRIIKYKKGPIAFKRREFRRLQRLLRVCLAEKFPQLTINQSSDALLRAKWTKPVEDQLDAFFCALIGLWHWQYRGKCSEVIGDVDTGFILLPMTGEELTR